MGPIESKIIEKLRLHFSPSHLELENESHKHGFSRGPEGHFKLLLVAEMFEDLKTLERHQRIYSLLKDELGQGVHALAIRALTPGEFAQQTGDFTSPACRHR